jgi:hypothetical protein
MSKNFKPRRTSRAVLQLIEVLNSGRKVRPVVTPSGHRARGYFPSLKALRAGYESLVEEDSLRIFEVAPSVLTVQTHPLVLKLATAEPDGSSWIHYTPDFIVTLIDTATVVEAKGDWLLKLPEPRASLRRTLLAARRHDLPLALLSETEARPAGLQDELKLLLHERPTCNRRRRDFDATRWDPTGQTEPSGQTLRRWREAQKACDELLDRVMRRDPDEVIASLEV